MPDFPTVIQGIGSAAALYSLIHLVWAGLDSGYSGLNLFSRPSRDRFQFLGYANVLVLWVGCTLLCVGAASTLTAWMPFEWGSDFEGEFQSFKVRFSQVLGGMLGLACIGFLSASNQRKEIEADKLSAAISEAKREMQRNAKQEADSLRLASEERKQAVAAADRKKAEEQRAELQRLLRLMTEEELDDVWNCRPLISWTEPMKSMSSKEQRKHWAKHLLNATDWEIPEDLLRAVRDRQTKFSS